MTFEAALSLAVTTTATFTAPPTELTKEQKSMKIESRAEKEAAGGEGGEGEAEMVIDNQEVAPGVGLSDDYRHRRVPVVSAVHPAMGSVAGGVRIQIHGRNFLSSDLATFARAKEVEKAEKASAEESKTTTTTSPATPLPIEVYIGSLRCVRVCVVSDTLITAETPPRPPTDRETAEETEWQQLRVQQVKDKEANLMLNATRSGMTASVASTFKVKLPTRKWLTQGKPVPERVEVRVRRKGVCISSEADRPGRDAVSRCFGGTFFEWLPEKKKKMKKEGAGEAEDSSEDSEESEPTNFRCMHCNIEGTRDLCANPGPAHRDICPRYRASMVKRSGRLAAKQAEEEAVAAALELQQARLQKIHECPDLLALHLEVSADEIEASLQEGVGKGGDAVAAAPYEGRCGNGGNGGSDHKPHPAAMLTLLASLADDLSACDLVERGGCGSLRTDGPVGTLVSRPPRAWQHRLLLEGCPHLSDTSPPFCIGARYRGGRGGYDYMMATDHEAVRTSAYHDLLADRAVDISASVQKLTVRRLADHLRGIYLGSAEKGAAASAPESLPRFALPVQCTWRNMSSMVHNSLAARESTEVYSTIVGRVVSSQLVGHIGLSTSMTSAGARMPGSTKTAGGAVVNDVAGFLRAVCRMESRRREESVSRRWKHHIDKAGLDIVKWERQLLAGRGEHLDGGLEF